MEKRIYVVGGWCRDTLLNRMPKDKDYVAVGFIPKDFENLKQVGKSFPVFLTEDGDEVALARTERSTGDSYTDFDVDFDPSTTLEEDLFRRDLTINAIAYDQMLDTYIDPYKGMTDIESKTLRHVSDAFDEDPTRVLRLARFRAKYGKDFWKIAPETKVKCYELREKLADRSIVNKERIWKEVEQVLTYEHSYIFFETLQELGVLGAVFPNIHAMNDLKEGNKWHRESSVFEHTMRVIENCKSPRTRLAALYHDIAKPYSYRTYGNGSGHDNASVVLLLIDMTLPNKLRDDIVTIIKLHIKIMRTTEMTVGSLLDFAEAFKGDLTLLADLIEIARADMAGATTLETSHRKAMLPVKTLVQIVKAVNDYKVTWRKPEDSVAYIKARIRNDKCSLIRDILKLERT